MKNRLLLLALLLTGVCTSTCAQPKPDTVSKLLVDASTTRKLYAGNGLDFAMLSTAFVSRGGNTELTVPRFTAVVNFGFSLHYDVSNKFGLLSGVGLRNMGFIEKQGDRTYKHRVYSLGIPLGIKFGDLRNRNFAFGGAGVDFPFHYKEKTFVSRSNKTKQSEWFGAQTPRVLPFFFLGHSWDPGITIKLQYYPTNFVNEDYRFVSSTGTAQTPFAGYKVHLLLLSLGIDIHYGKYKMQERSYEMMRKQRERNKEM